MDQTGIPSQHTSGSGGKGPAALKELAELGLVYGVPFCVFGRERIW
jgi:hypothetical protein